MLWVYKKDQNRVLKTQQSPKAIFFEWERNLFDVNGTPGDNIEKMYADVDDMLSKTLDKILATRSMTGRELTWMIFLVGLMKWRIPKVDTLFKELVKDVPIVDLGLKIAPVDPKVKVDPETVRRIENMDIVKETKRLLLAVQPLIKEEVLNEIHKNCFIVSNDQFPGLLGDCPIIESPNEGFDVLENFIFPLGTNDTLICKRGGNKDISNRLFYIHKDLTIFHLSEKYVACKDRSHLENVANLYANLVNEKKTHLLSKTIFEFVV
jgi:hypothetical protein